MSVYVKALVRYSDAYGELVALNGAELTIQIDRIGNLIRKLDINMQFNYCKCKYYDKCK